MAMPPVSTDPCAEPRLRADAALNRKLLLAAARTVFSEQGLDAPMTEVARRAGVGIATLYRRFPARADLITAVFDEKMDAYVAAKDAALADPDPWRGFCGYVERVCEMQAEDRGFTFVLTTSFPTARAFEAKRNDAYAGVTELIARAKAAGRLRADFADQDLVLLLMANAGVIAATADTLPDAWRRPVAYLLQAFAADNRGPLPEPPPGEALFRAMVRMRPGDDCPR
jgi:AcrR family transcriptional regulator